VTTSSSDSLYPDIGPKQRAYLARERRPFQEEVASLGPYPVAPQIAAAVEALSRHYVLPWHLVCERHLVLWTRDVCIAQGAKDVPVITPMSLGDKLSVFDSDAEADKYWTGADYHHGLAGVTDASFDKAFDTIQAIVAAFALEEPLKAGAALYMPSLLFGPTVLRYIPLIECRWIDREILALCEAGALLEESMLRLPPVDPHPLACDRFFARDENWAAPMPAHPQVLNVAITRATANLSRCPGKLGAIGGRPHINIDRYRLWPGRYIRGRVDDARVEGLIVNKWNDWIDQESESGWVEAGGFLLGKVEHPCPLLPEQDYQTIAGTQVLQRALAQRADAVAKLSGSSK
jgi:hypothetical protein